MGIIWGHLRRKEQNNGNQNISAKPKTVPKPAERGGYKAPLQTHNKKEEKKKGKCIIA